jgi:hypothetical protein
MPSDDEFDYMSDNFLAEWFVLYEIYSDIYLMKMTVFWAVTP